MENLSDDRKAELTNTIENIMQDAHNKAISDCHHLILGLLNDAGLAAKEVYCELEIKVAGLYRQ